MPGEAKKWRKGGSGANGFRVLEKHVIIIKVLAKRRFQRKGKSAIGAKENHSVKLAFLDSECEEVEIDPDEAEVLRGIVNSEMREVYIS